MRTGSNIVDFKEDSKQRLYYNACINNTARFRR